MKQPVIEIQSLVTTFRADDGLVTAIDGVSLSIERGRTLALVGESGCGKSVTSLSVMRLLPADVGEITSGQILFEGKDLAKLSETEMRGLRGNRMAMIFQEPMSALNPVLTAGEQVSEVFRIHRRMSRIESEQATLNMFEKVRIADPERRMTEYPHQMSGGMKQRVMIAMALACEPALLIADEPTTALDVTIQAQILHLMRELQRDNGAAVLFITHDLGVVAEMADDVAVMYAGQIVESSSVLELFDAPQHPYTQGLMKSIPGRDQVKSTPLPTIPGVVPSLKNISAGCRFCDRCSMAITSCKTASPELVEIRSGHKVACHVVAQRTLQGGLA